MISKRLRLLTRSSLPSSGRCSSYIQSYISRWNSSSISSSIEQHQKQSTTHFGFTEVPLEEKEGKVRQVFENVADNYDVMNDLMSGGLHRLWKDELLTMTGVGPIAKALRQSINNNNNNNNQNQKKLLNILDVAGGTGDMAFRFIDAAGCIERSKRLGGVDEISVTVCDINTEMLRVGEKRARMRYGNALLDESMSLTFKEGNAQYLPFEDNTFDIYTIAFGLRNVTDIDMALRDAYRVLKPGGRCLVLEFSKVDDPSLSVMYDLYSFHVIPKIGEVVAHDRASYQYLVESIRKFCNQEELKQKMESAMFTNCKFHNLSGGIVSIHEGWKKF